LTPDFEHATMVEKAREWVREAGRRPKGFGIEGACIQLASTDDNQPRRMLEGWRRLGATHVTLDWMGDHFEPPQGNIGCYPALQGDGRVCGGGR
jgi:hypothetical protein